MFRAFVVQTRSGQIVSAHKAQSKEQALNLAEQALKCNPLPGRESMLADRWEKEFKMITLGQVLKYLDDEVKAFKGGDLNDHLVEEGKVVADGWNVLGNRLKPVRNELVVVRNADILADGTDNVFVARYVIDLNDVESWEVTDPDGQKERLQTFDNDEWKRI